MENKNFLALHTNIDNNKTNATKNNLDMANVMRNEKDRAKYLAWVSDFATIDGNAQSVKNAQNCINKAPTQKLMFGLTGRETLTHKTRMKRGNTKLLEAGLCTQADIDSKQYMCFTTLLPPTKIHTALGDLQKVQMEFTLTKNQLLKLVDKIKYTDEPTH